MEKPTKGQKELHYFFDLEKVYSRLPREDLWLCMRESELKMMRFSLGVTMIDRIRNKHIRGTA